MTVEARRALVAEMVTAGKTLPAICDEIITRKIVNPRTGKNYSKQTIQSDIARARKAPVSETIGQWSTVKPQWQAKIQYTVDTTYKDYVFLDALRRGTAIGYEVGGLFCTPIAQTIASYVFGKGISAALMDGGVSRTTLHENGKPTQNLRNAQNPAQQKPSLNPGWGNQISYTNAQIKRMIERNQGFFLSMLVDEYCLGNQYAICNPDCTFSVASPEMVTVDYSASDYRRPIRYIIRTKSEAATTEDIYTAEKRILIIQYHDRRGTQKYEYENLIGRIPIVHFANDRSANEIYGRCLYEAAIPLMRRYDDLMLNIVQGVELLGNPMPTFTGLENINATKAANADAHNYIDQYGNQQTEYVLRFDRQRGIMVGKGADFKLTSTPVGFTKDSLDTLRQLFILLLNHTRIPEFLWGASVASSKASTDSQMPPFIQYINFRRLLLEGEGADPVLRIEARGGLLELIDIWLRTYKLLNPAIVVGPVAIKWPDVDNTDANTKLLWGQYLRGIGDINSEQVVELAGYWDDPATTVAQAAGKQQRPNTFDTYDKKLRQAELELAQQSQQPPDDNGMPISTDYAIPLDDQLYQTSIGGTGGGNPAGDIPISLIGPLTVAHQV